MIFDPVRVVDDFSIQLNTEQYEFLNDIDVVKCIDIQLSNHIHIEKDAPARRVSDKGFCGNRQRGRLCLR